MIVAVASHSEITPMDAIGIIEPVSVSADTYPALSSPYRISSDCVTRFLAQHQPSSYIYHAAALVRVHVHGTLRASLRCAEKR